MQATRCLLYTSCNLFFNLTKIVHFRMKLRNLQHVNKTPWLYVQQGKHSPINIQNFLCICILIYIHDDCLDVKNNLNYYLYPFHSYIIWQKTKTKRRIGLYHDHNK